MIFGIYTLCDEFILQLYVINLFILVKEAITNYVVKYRTRGLGG